MQNFGFFRIFCWPGKHSGKHAGSVNQVNINQRALPTCNQQSEDDLESDDGSDDWIGGVDPQMKQVDPKIGKVDPKIVKVDPELNWDINPLLKRES